MAQISKYLWIPLFDGYRIIGFAIHDNAAGRFLTQFKWAELFGPIRPIWIVKRDMFEIGIELMGCMFTLFVE